MKIFRADGTVVSNRPVKMPCGLKPWMIDRYMSLLHRSVSPVKLGVGYVKYGSNYLKVQVVLKSYCGILYYYFRVVMKNCKWKKA